MLYLRFPPLNDLIALFVEFPFENIDELFKFHAFNVL